MNDQVPLGHDVGFLEIAVVTAAFVIAAVYVYRRFWGAKKASICASCGSAETCASKVLMTELTPES